MTSHPKCRAKNPETCQVHGNAVSNSYNSPQEMVLALKTEHTGLQIVVKEFGKVIDLDVIIIPKQDRGKGIGRKVMETLTRYADEKQLSIQLQPDDVFGTPKQQLIVFYQKFGFVAKYANFHGYRIIESMSREPNS